MRHLFPILCLTALSACSLPLSASTDMQGVDPTDYYSQHPIENKVMSRTLSQAVHFLPGQPALIADDQDELREGLRDISPAAVDSITIWLARDDKFVPAREHALAAMLKKMGYGKVQFKFSASLKPGTAWIDIAYLAVVSPNCPDWRTSPVTSHSNTWQGNFYCATTSDIGLMVADPHDLARGTGDVPINTERTAQTVQNYNEGMDFMPNTLNAGNTGSSSGSSSSSSNGSSAGTSSTNTQSSTGSAGAGSAPPP